MKGITCINYFAKPWFRGEVRWRVYISKGCLMLADAPNIRLPLADTTQLEAHQLWGRKQKQGREHKH